MSKPIYSDTVTPRHIDNLMNTDRIVIRYYNGKRRLEKVEFSPKDLDEYLNHFISRGFALNNTNPKEGV
jgi:hypothetical protein